MNYLALPPVAVDDSDSITRPMLPRFALPPASLPRFRALPSFAGDESVTLTRPMPLRRLPMDSRWPRTVRRLWQWAHWPAVFYGLSAGVVLGVVLWLVVMPFAARVGGDEAGLAAGGPSTTLATVVPRFPAATLEDQPPLVRGEDLPIAARPEPRPPPIAETAYTPRRPR